MLCHCVPCFFFGWGGLKNIHKLLINFLSHIKLVLKNSFGFGNKLIFFLALAGLTFTHSQWLLVCGLYKYISYHSVV